MEKSYPLDIIRDLEPAQNKSEITNEIDVLLSEEIEHSIEQNLLPNTIQLARESGIGEEELHRFEACYKALGNRPSQAGFGPSFHFRADGKYFFPQVSFDRYYGAMPDVLTGTPYKLRRSQEAETEANFEQVDPSRVIKVFEGKQVRSYSFTEAEARTEPINNYEKHLTKLNRLMYRVHDALHIYQSILIGDQLNSLKAKLNAVDLFDENIERTLVKRGNYARNVDWKPPEWAKDSIFTDTHIPENSKIPDKNPQIVNNEATMDIISEWLIKEELEKHPELLLWLHNTMANLVGGLEIIKNYYQTTTDFDAEPPVFEDQIVHAIDMITGAYFSAFDDSDQAKEKLSKMEFEVMGQQAKPTIADGAYFDRITIANLKNELRFLNKGLTAFWQSSPEFDEKQSIFLNNRKNEVEFPSGQKFLAMNISYGPVTTHGARLAAEIFNAHADAGNDGLDVQEWFFTLQKCLDEVKPDEKESMEKAIINSTKDFFGIKLSANDLHEMKNIFHYLDMSKPLNGDSYPVQVALRKILFENIKQTHPEQVNNMISWTFFESPMYFVKEDYLDMTGFGHATEQDLSPKIIPWEELLTKTRLGLFRINMTKLENDELHDIKRVYDKGHTKHDQLEDFQVLAAIARRQRQDKII